MPNFQEMLNSEQSKKLIGNAEKLERLRDAPETQRLFQLLERSAGGELEQAANRAAQGDAGTLMDAVRQLMQSQEGQQLLQQMRESMK